MNRSAPRFRTYPHATRVQVSTGFALLGRLVVGVVLLVTAALLAPGFVLDAPQPPPRKSDAIVVISGDEQLARFAEGINLYQQGFGSYLVQELKRVCYEAGKKPAARCNADNVASRRTLQKAGFLPCGRLLVGDVTPSG